MLTYTSVVRASVEGLAGTFIGRSFFWRRGISFGFGQFVSLSTEAIFSFKFWEAASIVSLGEAKMASFLRSSFGFEFGAKVCLSWSLWQVIPDWLVLEATGCEQRELSLVCCGSTSMIPAAKL